VPRIRASAGPEVQAGEVQWLDGGVTAVPGILAGGVAAGIKPSGKKDLALIYSPTPARAAAVFTTNQVVAAPCVITRRHVELGAVRAIVVNSGNANACTGDQGKRDAVALEPGSRRLLLGRRIDQGRGDRGAERRRQLPVGSRSSAGGLRPRCPRFFQFEPGCGGHGGPFLG